ncbi:MAG: hypothetical protein KGZ85_02945 [Ignavibacterium sp.]|nr:hypothetical protein [Ignavibacterium sp.]
MKNFSFPYKSVILIFSVFMIFLPVFFIGSLSVDQITTSNPGNLRLLLTVSTLSAAIGFIYCTLGYHFQILRGDELKLRIHLEALNISFTTTLVFLFALIFVFLNFNPTLLNYLIIILAIIAIIAYIIGVELVKRNYR